MPASGKNKVASAAPRAGPIMKQDSSRTCSNELAVCSIRLAAQQVRPPGPDQRARLGHDRVAEVGEDEHPDGCPEVGGEDQREQRGCRHEGERHRHPPLSVPVDQPPDGGSERGDAGEADRADDPGEGSRTRDGSRS